jgi:hypothetical protein
MMLIIIICGIHLFFHLILAIFIIFINVKSITFARWDVGSLSFEDHQIQSRV